jgi:hypothetical protein
VVVPYTPFRLKMGFSLPMEKEHLLTALREITVDLSALTLHIPDYNDENSTTFFSAFLHSKEESTHSAFLSKEIAVSPFVIPSSPSPQNTPLSPSKVPPASPSKSPSNAPPQGGRAAISLSFSLPAAAGMTARDVFTAFKEVGEEKGKGKGAWNVLFVFDRDGIFYVDVWGDPSLVDEVTSVIVGGKQVSFSPIIAINIFL